jgi:predicted nucleotidyltransferase
MIAMDQIELLSKRIAREFQPERIILFGSYAYGTPKEHSDVDLLVLMPFKGNGLSKALQMVTKLKPKFSVDLLVRTPKDLETRLKNNDWFLQEVLKRGSTKRKVTTRRPSENLQPRSIQTLTLTVSIVSSVPRSTLKPVCIKQTLNFPVHTTC